WTEADLRHHRSPAARRHQHDADPLRRFSDRGVGVAGRPRRCPHATSRLRLMTVPTGNVVHKEATKNPIERRMVDGFSAALQRCLPDSARRVLEVGCGEGRQLTAIGSRFPSAELVGLDLPDVELMEAWDGVESAMVQGSDLYL